MIKLQDHREVFQATIWGRIIYTQKYYGFAFALFRYALHVMQLQQLQLLPSCMQSQAAAVTRSTLVRIYT